MWLKEAARGRGCVLPVVFINYTRQQYEGMQRGRGAAVRGEEGERRVAWRQLRLESLLLVAHAPQICCIYARFLL